MSGETTSGAFQRLRARGRRLGVALLEFSKAKTLIQAVVGFVGRMLAGWERPSGGVVEVVASPPRTPDVLLPPIEGAATQNELDYGRGVVSAYEALCIQIRIGTGGAVSLAPTPGVDRWIDYLRKDEACDGRD